MQKNKHGQGRQDTLWVLTWNIWLPRVNCDPEPWTVEVVVPRLV